MIVEIDVAVHIVVAVYVLVVHVPLDHPPVDMYISIPVIYINIRDADEWP
jgi:hypothetical protein